jgi:hypothetical protein
MRYATEMASGGMIHIPSLMTTGSGIQVILRLVHEHFQRLQCWNYYREEFMKYATEMS